MRGQGNLIWKAREMAYSIADTLWVFLAAILVFFMNLGFACVEAGFARAKNTVNILSKNFIVFAVSSLGFLLLGWGLMFGGGTGLLVTQLIGVAAVGAFVLAASGLVWLVLKYTVGIRVSAQEELSGLDIGERGYDALQDEEADGG